MKILVLNTGGTISCVGSPLAPMTASEFADASRTLVEPIVHQQFASLQIDYLTSLAFPESSTRTLDSTNLQPSDWCIMAQAILDNYLAYDGFVVLHGTDSMDFSGAALSFLLNGFDSQGLTVATLGKPVIITGSQVPLYHRASQGAPLTLNYNTDGLQNFCGALALAQVGVPEVGVYFRNQLYRGNRAVKTNASAFDAFSSPNYPALADYGISLTLNNATWLPGPVHTGVSLDNATVLRGQQALVAAIAESIDRFPVMQLNAFPAHYSMAPARAFMADLVQAVVKAGAVGIILEAYGEGNFPSGNPDKPSEGAIYQALAQANQQGVNLVDCTQVVAGMVNNSAYAAGAWLPAVGALAPADMTPMAALAKLMVLMAAAGAKGWSREQVQVLFQTNLAGEMLGVNQLDSRGSAELLPGQSISALDGSAVLVNDPAAGPLLTGTGTVAPLWRLPQPLPSSALPGRLVMQNDGNLVFYSRDNQPLWATNTGRADGASSRLVLTGHYKSAPSSASTLTLQVLDYSANAVAATLYPAV